MTWVASGMKAQADWNVTRTGGTVRIDMNAADDLSEADRNAMISAAEELLDDENVRLVQLDGHALGPRPYRGLADTGRALEMLADKHGKPLWAMADLAAQVCTRAHGAERADR